MVSVPVRLIFSSVVSASDGRGEREPTGEGEESLPACVSYVLRGQWERIFDRN